ncbi:penicillin-binding protein 1B [Desulfopila sp. IMCC35008]|uniref:penicillin-binding protein 1B n=1 Tax=Desulfopila sp. IMCC35008 TaxID=2653858 RepID=UPI0013D5378C|nr:penicillin-binding protein 1B [Desulfopila sp. IMCC35008]
MKKFFLFIFLPILLMTATIGGFTAYRHIQALQSTISKKFDGKKWALPAVVYARPLELYPGLQLDPDMFENELLLCGYRSEKKVHSSGGYSRTNSSFHLITRPFSYPGGKEESASIRIDFIEDSILKIVAAQDSTPVSYVRIDPARIGSFHPLEHEDRLVLTNAEVPQLLKQSLIAVEDRDFYQHHGISIKGIVRALLTNIRAGRTVQGGSTITQQLVKNLFLNREQTLKRKFQEAVMAILLDRKYAKDEIMTAYINEVFLGQDGARAIHGFGLASQFFFRRDINDLSIAQIATLVGMVKGPSSYDPRRHPETALARRQQVLKMMQETGVIDTATQATAGNQPLTDVAPQKIGFNRFPAFLDLVKRQLQEEYHEKDLNSDGLQILTTLDPLTQIILEEQLELSISQLEQERQLSNIEGAAVITSRDTGEIEAIVGGKHSRTSGFNRALDANRPVGSLIKPAVYLAGLEQGYTLASPLLDQRLTLKTEGETWRPENYDRQEHGRVALYRALAKSYNLATVRLGLDVGLETVIDTIRRMGYSGQLKNYPSLLLGAVSMTPLQITQIYQTIGSGGFYQPLRSIRSVMDASGKTLNRYGLAVEQRFLPEHIYLLNHGLQRVMEEGTGRKLQIEDAGLYSGKTGTSDGLRDSWFAGFTANRLSVVWLGKDDNTPTSLTGSTGALRAWGDIVENLKDSPSQPTEPESITWHRIDTTTFRPTSIFNRNSTKLPFLRGHEPVTVSETPKPRTTTASDIENDLHELEKEARKNLRHAEKEARKIIKSLNDLLK